MAHVWVITALYLCFSLHLALGSRIVMDQVLKRAGLHWWENTRFTQNVVDRICSEQGGRKGHSKREGCLLTLQIFIFLSHDMTRRRLGGFHSNLTSFLFLFFSFLTTEKSDFKSCKVLKEGVWQRQNANEKNRGF